MNKRSSLVSIMLNVVSNLNGNNHVTISMPIHWYSAQWTIINNNKKYITLQATVYFSYVPLICRICNSCNRQYNVCAMLKSKA